MISSMDCGGLSSLFCSVWGSNLATGSELKVDDMHCGDSVYVAFGTLQFTFRKRKSLLALASRLFYLGGLLNCS